MGLATPTAVMVGTGKGAHLIADGKLVVVTSRGDLVLAKASADGFEEVEHVFP